MKKTLIIIGIIVLGGLIYFAATTKTGVTPPSVSDSPPPAGKAPVIASITPSKTSSCCVNIEGEGFLTDEATNEVIWTHKEKGFKIWGGGWLSMDGKNLEEVPIPVWNGKYNVIAKNRNGISNIVSYTVDWTGVHAGVGVNVINVQPLNALPGEKITIETTGSLIIYRQNKKEKINKVQIRLYSSVIKGIDIREITPDFELSIEAIDDDTISFNLPAKLKKNSEYLIKLIAPFGGESYNILYKTGK